MDPKALIACGAISSRQPSIQVFKDNGKKKKEKKRKEITVKINLYDLW